MFNKSIPTMINKNIESFDNNSEQIIESFGKKKENIDPLKTAKGIINHFNNYGQWYITFFIILLFLHTMNLIVPGFIPVLIRYLSELIKGVIDGGFKIIHDAAPAKIIPPLEVSIINNLPLCTCQN